MKQFKYLFVLLVLAAVSANLSGCYTQFTSKDERDNWTYKEDDEDNRYADNSNESGSYYDDGYSSSDTLQYNDDTIVNNYYFGDSYYRPFYRRYYSGYHPGVTVGISFGNYYDPFWYDSYYRFGWWSDWYVSPYSYWHPYVAWYGPSWWYYGGHGHYHDYYAGDYKYRKNDVTRLRNYGGGRSAGLRNSSPLAGRRSAGMGITTPTRGTDRGSVLRNSGSRSGTDRRSGSAIERTGGRNTRESIGTGRQDPSVRGRSNDRLNEDKNPSPVVRRRNDGQQQKEADKENAQNPKDNVRDNQGQPRKLFTPEEGKKDTRESTPRRIHRPRKADEGQRDNSGNNGNSGSNPRVNPRPESSPRPSNDNGERRREPRRERVEQSPNYNPQPAPRPQPSVDYGRSRSSSQPQSAPRSSGGGDDSRRGRR